MSNSPLVTIVVPVYNGEKYLRQSLDSILAQSYPRLEVLVMDDASTDSTPDIIDSYGDRIQSVRQPQNRGIYGNMNDGITLVQGEYIALYHADDVYHPDIVAREVSFLQRHPETGAVFCQDIFIDPSGREDGRLLLPPEVQGGQPLDFPVIFNALLKYKNRFLPCPSCMVPAAVLRDVGGFRDAEFLNTSDLELWLRIAREYPIAVLEEYLFRYRHGHGSSAGRYHHLRTDQERYFLIMDLYLENGGRDEAGPEALAAYEAHRAEDQLMRVASLYILKERREARSVLSEIRPSRILGSPQIQRGRMLILFILLHGLVRLPRIGPVADLFGRRWHAAGKEA